MKVNAFNLLALYENPFKMRDRYIKKYLNKAINKVKQNQQFLELTIVKNEQDEKSLIFNKHFSSNKYDFVLTKQIFDVLFEAGYRLVFDFNEDNKHIDNMKAGKVKIAWDKEVDLNNDFDYKVVLRPSNLRRKYNPYINIAKRYIEEVVEPQMIEVAKYQTYIELPAENDMEWGYRNSIVFSKEYSLCSLNNQLTNEIIKTLKLNGFKCEFDIYYDPDHDTRLGNNQQKGHLKISWK